MIEWSRLEAQLVALLDLDYEIDAVPSRSDGGHPDVNADAPSETALQYARLTRDGARRSDPLAGPYLRRKPACAADGHGPGGPAPARRRSPVPAGDRNRRR